MNASPGGGASSGGGLRLAAIGFGVAVIGLALALVFAMGALREARVKNERDVVFIRQLQDEVKMLSEDREHRVRGSFLDSLHLARYRGGDLDQGLIQRLKAHGLSDPVRDLKADLRSHPELIPVPGVLGGRMGFHDVDAIRVLDGKWVYARFDDGHIEGTMLLEYRVQNGRIAWKRLVASPQ